MFTQKFSKFAQTLYKSNSTKIAIFGITLGSITIVPFMISHKQDKIIQSNTEEVRTLIKKEEYKKIKEKLSDRTRMIDYDTLLRSAMLCKNEKILILLIKSGADVNYTSKYSLDDCAHILNWALYQEFYDLANILIEKGSDINYIEKYRMNTPIKMAAVRNNNALIKKILSKGCTTINFTNGREYSSLDHAIGHDNIEGVQLLIKHGASIEYSAYRLVKQPLILQAILNENIVSKRTKEVIFNEAIKQNNENSIISLLESGLKVDKKLYNGYTPLEMINKMKSNDAKSKILRHVKESQCANIKV